MTNLTSPAADAALGLSQTNTMADVIDSLKRLERVGSENSKTTQKLIDAATELSSVIAQQFALSPDEELPIQKWEEQKHAAELDEFLSHATVKFNYVIRRQGDSNPALYLHKGPITDVFVGRNRDAALEFSKDVADGLLEYILGVLEERRAESAKALSIIEGATTKLRNPS
jgi:hypothetical protein